MLNGMKSDADKYKKLKTEPRRGGVGKGPSQSNGWTMTILRMRDYIAILYCDATCFLLLFIVISSIHFDASTFYVFICILTQRKFQQHVKKLKLKMNPCGIAQNMIRLVMVFTPPGVDFTAAFWYHGSRIFSFSLHTCVSICIYISFSSLMRMTAILKRLGWK